MKESHELNQVVTEILSELDLHEKVVLANMEEDDVAILQVVFDELIQSKIATSAGDDEQAIIMDAIWKKLKTTHRLRIVK